MKYCGIDLHSNNCVVIISDEEDRIVLSKRLPNDLGQILAALEPHREELTGLVIESTYNWYWLVDGLMDSGYRVHLAHPSAIKKYEGLKHSGAPSKTIRPCASVSSRSNMTAPMVGFFRVILMACISWDTSTAARSLAVLRSDVSSDRRTSLRPSTGRSSTGITKRTQ